MGSATKFVRPDRAVTGIHHLRADERSSDGSFRVIDP